MNTGRLKNKWVSMSDSSLALRFCNFICKRVKNRRSPQIILEDGDALDNPKERKNQKRRSTRCIVAEQTCSSLGLLDLRGDAVQVAEALRRQSSATVGVLLDELERLQSLHHLSRHRAGSATEVRRAHSVVLAG